MSSILFNKKERKHELNFLTKKFEILNEPLKTQNGYFLNLKSRQIPQSIKEVSNETVQFK